MSRFVLKCVAIGGVTAGSYCTGAYLERRRTVATLERGLSIDGAILEGVLSSGNRLKSKPGLPVFGTVSAATPISGTELAVGPARVSEPLPLCCYCIENFLNVNIAHKNCSPPFDVSRTIISPIVVCCEAEGSY